MSGSNTPAPKPCTTRNTIRLPTFQDAAEATEPIMNSTSPNIHRRLPPILSTAQAVTGMVAVSASK